jgi:hypothetical protein
MSIFQGTADQIASKEYTNKVAAQRIPKLTIGRSAPYYNVIAVYESGNVDGNGLPLDAEYKHIPIEQEDIGVQPNFIVKRKANGNIMTNTPVADLDCANKKYVDDAVAGAGGGSADLSNYYTKAEIDAKIGDIETLLGGI